jgi:hypothetical protein
MDTIDPMQQKPKRQWNERKKFDDEMLRKLWEGHGSTYAISKRLKCTHEHVRRELKRIGIEAVLKKGEHHPLTYIGDNVTPREHGVVARWLRTHPDIRLPRNVGEIARIIGCEPGHVSTYFYRRRRKQIAKLDRLPDIRVLDLLLKDTDGNEHDSAHIADYRFTVEMWGLTTTIEATLVNGMELSFPIPDQERFERVLEDALLQFSTYHPEAGFPNPPSATRLVRSGQRVRRCTNPLPRHNR